MKEPVPQMQKQFRLIVFQAIFFSLSDVFFLFCGEPFLFLGKYRFGGDFPAVPALYFLFFPLFKTI